MGLGLVSARGQRLWERAQGPGPKRGPAEEKGVLEEGGDLEHSEFPVISASPVPVHVFLPGCLLIFLLEQITSLAHLLFFVPWCVLLLGPERDEL